MHGGTGGDLRRHFNYSNVMSTLSVFLVIAGGSAMAAQIKDSGDIAKEAVKNSDVKKETLKSNRLKDGKAVATEDVVDDTLTGADVDESQLEITHPSSLPPNGPAGGSLAGQYPNPALGTNSVGAAQVAPDSLDSTDLGAESVATAELAPSSVLGEEVADGTLDGVDVGITAGSSTEDFPAIAVDNCATETVTVPPGFPSIQGEAVVASPPLAWGGDFSFNAESGGPTTFQLKACNNGTTDPEDPDGAGGEYPYVIFDV